VLAATRQFQGYSVDLLFIGVALTISGPIFFRTIDSEGTRLGMQTMVSVGHDAIVLALLALLPLVFHRDWLNLIGVLGAAVLVVREAQEVSTEIEESRKLIRALACAWPQAAYLARVECRAGRCYRYSLKNGGEACASRLVAHLTDDAGEIVSDHAKHEIGGSVESDPLQPGGTRKFDVSVRADRLDRNPLHLRFTWQDSATNKLEVRFSRAAVPTE
jgi:hypothetical protein